jgi:hypothetical protein
MKQRCFLVANTARMHSSPNAFTVLLPLLLLSGRQPAMLQQ